MDTNNKYEARFTELYSKLNENQKNAVDTIDGPVMVVAGPGTGKTQTISLRIANILRQTQLDPENILCLTFTESAVNTMRRRLLDIIGEAAYRIRIYTFHGFCNEVIQSHPEKFQEFGAKSEPLSDIDKFKMFSGIIDQLPYDSPLKPFGNTESYIWELPSMISGFKKDNISIEQITEAVRRNIDFHDKSEHLFQALKQIHYRQLNGSTFTRFINDLQALGFADFGFVSYLIKLIESFSGDRYSELRNQIYTAFEDGFKANITRKQQEFINVFKNYQASLRTEGKYDYDDMIKSVVEKFQTDKALLYEYQERYQYILVDEFQDTNSAQNEVIRLLGSFWSDPNIFVVGDDDQSIFRFQGASVENMIFFYNTYLSKIRVISLTENYRSQQLVLDAAREVISHNGLQVNEMIPNLSKKLHAFHQEFTLTPVAIKQYRDPKQEASAVAEKVAALLAQGVNGKEIAVIYRDNADADDITEALNAKSVSYRLEKGEDVLDNPLIKQLLNLMRYIIDPQAAVPLFELLNYQFWGINKFDLVKLFKYAAEKKLDYLSIISSAEDLNAAGISEQEKLSELSARLTGWRQELYNDNALVFFNKLLRDSGFLNYVLSLPGHSVVLNKLARLYHELQELMRNREAYNLSEFIGDLLIYQKYHIELSDKLWGMDNDKAVRLMTAHGAKGMEFEHVFIVKCQDKKWGFRNSSSKIRPPFGLMRNQLVASENDEERRLFYVALTRAKKELHISYARYNSRQKEQNPSRFILEIPEQLSAKEQQITNEEQEAQEFLNVVQNSRTTLYSESAKELLKNILADYRLSVSDVIAYRKCPRCFYFNRLLRVPAPVTRSQAMGIAAHSALKQLLDTYKQTKTLSELGFLLNQYVTVLRQQHLEEKDFLEALKQGELLLSGYFTASSQSFPQDSMSELSFRNSSVVVNNVPLTGKIDRVDFLDQQTGALCVVDYKTGNPDSAGSKLSVNLLGDYYLQLVFYKLLLENSHMLRGYVKSGRVEFLMASKEKGAYTPREYELTSDATAPVLELITNTYEGIMNFDFERLNEDNYNSCANPSFHELDWHF